MIQLLTVIRSGVPALVVVTMDDDDFFVLGIAGDDVARSANLSIASLRGCRRVIDHHIMYEPIQMLNTRKLHENYEHSHIEVIKNT